MHRHAVEACEPACAWAPPPPTHTHTHIHPPPPLARLRPRRFPSDYRNGVEWYQYDPTKWFIRACAFIGLASDLHRFPSNEIDKGALQMRQKARGVGGSSPRAARSGCVPAAAVTSLSCPPPPTQLRSR